jgi:periplasmic copper chaperone A
MKRRGFFSLLAVVLALAPVWSQAQDRPQFLDVWARATVPGQDMGGAFLRIVGGRSDDRLLGASSPLAMAVELHSMRMEGDVMRMRAVESIAVPAGKTVALSPGGFHLMLMGLNEPLKAGMRLPLTLHFEKAGDVPVEAQVMLRPPQGASKH